MMTYISYISLSNNTTSRVYSRKRNDKSKYLLPCRFFKSLKMIGRSLFFGMFVFHSLLTFCNAKEEDSIMKNMDSSNAKHYYLERRGEDGKLLAKYTNELTLNDQIFNLNTQHNQNKVQEVFFRGRGASHLLANGICCHSGGIERTDIDGSLGFQNIKAPSLPLDWVSSDSDPQEGQYNERRAGRHSEDGFISDMNALWDQNHSDVLRLLIPSSISHGDKTVYMTGIELFGSFDACSTRHPYYGCIEKLVDFRKQHQQGQKSISQAIKAFLRDRFKGSDSSAFVLTYHTKIPYPSSNYSIGSNNENILLQWKDAKFEPSSPKSSSISLNDTFSQYNNTNEEGRIIYEHIQILHNKKFKYSEDGKLREL